MRIVAHTTAQTLHLRYTHTTYIHIYIYIIDTLRIFLLTCAYICMRAGRKKWLFCAWERESRRENIHILKKREREHLHKTKRGESTFFSTARPHSFTCLPVIWKFVHVETRSWKHIYMYVRNCICIYVFVNNMFLYINIIWKIEIERYLSCVLELHKCIHTNMYMEIEREREGTLADT